MLGGEAPDGGVLLYLDTRTHLTLPVQEEVETERQVGTETDTCRRSVDMNRFCLILSILIMHSQTIRSG